MNREIWKRLLWKEWRENWLYLGVGVGVPLVSTSVFKLTYKSTSDVYHLYSIIFICSLIVVLLSAFNTRERTPGQPAYKHNLPISYFMINSFNYVTSMMMSSLIGIILGFTFIWTDLIVKTTTPDRGITDLTYITLMMLSILVMLSCSMLVVVVTRIMTLVPGLVAGIAFIFLIINLEYYRDGFDYYIFLWLATSIILIAVIGEICVKKRREKVGQILIIIIIAVIFLTPLVIESTSSYFVYSHRGKAIYKTPTEIYNMDLSCFVKISNSKKNNTMELNYENRNTNYKKTRLLKGYYYPLAIMENNTDILFMQMNKGDMYACLMHWNPITNKVAKIVAIAKHFNKIDDCFIPIIKIKGNYALLYTPTQIRLIGRDENFDVWIVDAVNKRAKFIMPNTEILKNEYIKWEIDKLLYFYCDKKIIIDLPSLNLVNSESPVARAIQ